ncbi:MAG: DEAD/DEAH box helicase [Gemmatimonadaceae bacterium]
MKRVFPRAPQYAAEQISISNTPENCRDLQWFLERYPMRVDRPELLAGQAQEHIDTQIRLTDLLDARHPPDKISLARPPREYQEMAAHMVEIMGGLLLADDLGTGKSVAAICSMTRSENLPALVVCPAHLPGQWADMLASFAPDLKVHILRKGKPYPLIRPERGGQRDLLPDRLPDVIITSYHKLRGWAETLAGVVRLVVFDECQQLRNPGSEIYTAAKFVADSAHRRVGLSATPIYNYGSEFFWVVDALRPGALGQRDEFVREWCIGEGGDKARISDSKEFGAYLRREGIMLRRTRAEVGRELPALTRIVHTVDADSTTLNAMKGDAVTLARIVLSHNEQYRGQKMQAAGEFDSLMGQATGLAKAPYVAEFVRLLLDAGERVVLFGWHREVYSIWLEALKDFRPQFYTGSESASQKTCSITAFTTGESPLLIMSLRSGAGVDGLQGFCHIGVFGELDWSPGVHEQCMGRFHRDGQSDSCLAYFLVAEDGADPVMAEVLGVKREQIEGVRNPDRALAERIDTCENNIQRLAREFLARRGETVFENEPIAICSDELVEVGV